MKDKELMDSEDVLIARIAALHAAATAWAGMSAISNRDGAMLTTAEKFEEWLMRDIPA